MLFKTRVGLCVLDENIEIRIFPPSGGRTWGILAQYRGGPEMESKSLTGRSVRLGGVWFYLAAFQDHESVEADIGKAMQIIVDAYSNSATVCDLSQVGSAEAWRESHKDWAVVQWP